MTGALAPVEGLSRSRVDIGKAVGEAGIAAWERHVVPAIDALEGLPEPDRAREFGQRHQLTVLTPP